MKIVTAKKFREINYQLENYGRILSLEEEIKEFARLHVQGALEAAAKNIRIENADTGFKRTSVKEGGQKYILSASSILEAYPLTNIT